MLKSASGIGATERKVAVYLAPTKASSVGESSGTDCRLTYHDARQALCSERFNDWKDKFAPVGLRSLEYTGDTDGTKGFAAESRNIDIIITTVSRDI